MPITGLFLCLLPRTSLVLLILYQERRSRRTTTYLFQAFAGEKDRIWLFQLAQMGLSKFYSWYESYIQKEAEVILLLKPSWFRGKTKKQKPQSKT